MSEILETDKYFIIAIVFGSIFVGLLTFNQYSNGDGELIPSSAVTCLCLTIGFGLGGLVKVIMNRKR